MCPKSVWQISYKIGQNWSGYRSAATRSIRGKVDGSGRMTTRNRKVLRKYLPVVPTKPSITINTDIEYKRILENPGIRPLPFKKNDPPAPVLPTPENNYEPSETPMSLYGEVPIRVQTPRTEHQKSC